MTHDSTAQAEGMGFSQAQFLGWLGLGLICLMALATLVVIGSAAAHGFQ